MMPHQIARANAHRPLYLRKVANVVPGDWDEYHIVDDLIVGDRFGGVHRTAGGGWIASLEWFALDTRRRLRRAGVLTANGRTPELALEAAVVERRRLEIGGLPAVEIMQAGLPETTGIACQGSPTRGAGREDVA